MDLGAQLGFAWNFARNRERISLYLLFFLGALAVAGILLVLLFALAGGAIGAAGGVQAFARNPGAVAAVVGGVVLLTVLFVAFFLVLVGFWLWLSAGVMKNAAGEYGGGARASLRACLDYAKTRFWTVVAVGILVGIISFFVQLPFSLLSLVPFIGLFFLLLGVVARIVLAVGFLFSQFEAVVAERNAFDSLRESFALFLRLPLEVLLAAVAVLIAAIALFFLSLVLPALLVFVAGALAVALQANAAGLLLAFVLFLLAGLVFLAEIAFLELFVQGFLTAAFIDLTGAPSRALQRAPSRAPSRVPVRRGRAPRAAPRKGMKPR